MNSLNREERRILKKKIAPIAKQIVALEIRAKDPEQKEAAEEEISAIVEKLTFMEMMALEDYIYSKGLLKNVNNGNNH